jgi:hypothetical protein
MGKRGPKPKEKPVSRAEVAAQAPEPEEREIAVKEVEAQPETPAQEKRLASHDMCLFHKTEPTRFFKEGEEISDGFRDTPFMEDEK